MPLDKHTILHTAPGVTIKLETSIDIRLEINGKTLSVNSCALSILDAFSTARTFEEGMNLLKMGAPGPQAWIELTNEIMSLYKNGALLTPEQEQQVLQSDSARFDASEVHIRMLDDTERTSLYQRAIMETVTPDDIVIDIGTGTGILAATAARAGARHVYAIEASSMGRIAQQLFDDNDLSDRITLIQGKSTQINLPEKASVMVSEIIGNDPLDENVLPYTADAIERLLLPHARMIPGILRIYALPMTIPEDILKKQIFTQDTAKIWHDIYNLDFSCLVRATQRQSHSMIISTHHVRDWPVLAEPVLLSEIDLTSWRFGDIHSTNEMNILRTGVLNGILVYFELQLSENISLSIHPQQATETNSWCSKVWIPGKAFTVKAGAKIGFDYEFGATGSEFTIHPEP